MVEYLAGSVGIDIYPNTKGFGEELRRKLAGTPMTISMFV